MCFETGFLPRSKRFRPSLLTTGYRCSFCRSHKRRKCLIRSYFRHHICTFIIQRQYIDTDWGHPVALYYKIHNICSYGQTQLSIMSLIKSTHFATGFDQTWSSSGHIYIDTKIKAVHGLRCKCRWDITKWVFIIFMYGIPLYNVLRPIIINRCTAANNQLKSYKKY